MPEGALILHHLPYVTHIATLRFMHSYWRYKTGHTENI